MRWFSKRQSRNPRVDSVSAIQASSAQAPVRQPETLLDHPVCTLRAGIRRAEVIKRMGPPHMSIGSGQVLGYAARQPNLIVDSRVYEEPPSECWLYTDIAQGHDVEIVIEADRLATVRVTAKDESGTSRTVVKIDDHGTAAVDRYRSALGAKPL